MKVLIAGSNGYIGRHVKELFVESCFEVFTYSREQDGISQSGCFIGNTSYFEGYFDVVVNCARPHWSEFSPEEIADLEGKLLKRLDRLAAPSATKIHTSGVWLFGHASNEDLRHFRLKPFEVVKLDAVTINRILGRGWQVVYCPSLVYGGEHCQLQRIIESRSDGALQVAVPAQGFNQYIHVNDIAKFYLLLAQEDYSNAQHFIAEEKGYSPEEFAQLLLASNVIQKVDKLDWAEFEAKNGSSVADIEKLNLHLPISPLFKTTEAIRDYIQSYHV
tara:strand:- start:1188 stop:2012 length:825 start_codon:yes stop_codon:yes gene_type:complete